MHGEMRQNNLRTYIFFQKYFDIFSYLF